MSINLFSSYVANAKPYFNIWGELWVVLTFLFRMFTILIGSSVYTKDDLKEFKCDTYQPGCRLICYNRYLPLCPLRFWLYEILFTSVPPILFSFIASRQTLHYNTLKRLEPPAAASVGGSGVMAASNINNTTITTTEKLYLRQRRKYNRRLGLSKDAELDKVKNKTKKLLEDKSNKLEKEIILTPRIKQCYSIQAIIKLLIEVVFLYFQFVLQVYQNPRENDLYYIFQVPERYICEAGDDGRDSPCSQNAVIMCWNIRPWEKTVLLYYMTVVHICCIIVCVLEVFMIPITSSKRKYIKSKNKPKEDNAAITDEASLLELLKNKPIKIDGYEGHPLFVTIPSSPQMFASAPTIKKDDSHKILVDASNS